MPKFSYVAMDSRGKETKGTLDVANQNEAIGRLKEMGYFPTKVVEAEKPKEKGGKKAVLWEPQNGTSRGLEKSVKKIKPITPLGTGGWRKAPGWWFKSSLD